MAILGINLNDVQPLLVSGINIKTINGTTLLGSGDLAISASASWGGITGTLSDQTDLNSALSGKQATLVSGTNIKSINGTSLLGSGDLTIASGVSIGDAIGSATAGSVLFAGTSGVLAQSTGITYSDSNGLIITPTGTIVSGFKAGINIVSADPTLRLTDGVRGFGVFHSGTVTYIATTTTAWGSASYFGNIVGNKMFIGGTNSASAKLHISTNTATDIGLIVQGTTSQSGNLFEARDVSNNIMLTVTANGGLRLASYTVAGLPASPSVGDKYVVTDASGAAVVGSIVVGGGATMVEVVWANGGVGWKITSRY